MAVDLERINRWIDILFRLAAWVAIFIALWTDSYRPDLSVSWQQYVILGLLAKLPVIDLLKVAKDLRRT